MARGLTLAALVLALAACAGNPSRPAAAAPAGPPSPERVRELLDMQARAEAAYMAGRNDEAARLYTTLVAERPGDAAYWYRLGNALVRTGAHADAGFAYHRTVSLEPGNSRAWHNLGVVQMHLAQESLAEAVKHASGDRAVFDESLRLSAGLYSLVGVSSTEPSSGTAPAATDPSPAPGDGAGEPMSADGGQQP